ncbi:hypothetical protein [Sphingomonas gellani]|uniref:hypothetical protein n=1 Tax=Sphingomonas gellani TaxID=1166340 RepID=UPI001FCD5835|nr:hypothetical protein [Sphingomonas gellani]
MGRHRRVQAIRHLFAQRQLTVLICAATLLLKLLVPTGYMIATDHGRIAMTVCSGMAPAEDAASMHGGMPDHDRPRGHDKPDMPCAFAGLSAAALDAVDPIQLVAFLAFVMAIALHGAPLPAPVGRTHLRPPLRGPPATH